MRPNWIPAAGLLLLVACHGEEAAPTGPGPALARAPCSLGATDTEAGTILEDLLQYVADLRIDGGITAGQANAFRRHLEGAQRELADGDYCGVIEKLNNLKVQVTRLVADGALTPSDAAPLLDGIDTTFEGVLDRLSFETFRDGNQEVYSMNQDGSDPRNLSGNGGTDWAHDWSPDGSRIAFIRDGVLHVMNADGTGVTALANGYEPIGQPGWSPDGTMLAVPMRVGSTGGIHRVSLAGGTPALLSSGGTEDVEPQWSPNGARLVFASFRSGNEDIYVVNADGTGELQLTTALTEDRVPTWSPDGSKILWNPLVAVNPDSTNSEIFVMNPDGTGKTNLTNSEIHDIMPSWSHDGSRIVYVGKVDGILRSTVYSMNADGSGQAALSGTGQPALDEVPAWSPTDARIAFTRRSGGSSNYEIWVMKADGTGIANVSSNAANDINPRWRPR